MVDHSHGDLVSVDKEFCCPPARSLLSAYKEYPLSVVNRFIVVADLEKGIITRVVSHARILAEPSPKRENQPPTKHRQPITSPTDTDPRS